MEAKVLSMPTATMAKPNVKVTVTQEAVKGLMEPLIMALEPYLPEDIEDDRLERIVDFAVNLYAKNHKHMKQDRMLRKIAEEFKLKLQK